MVVDVLDKNEIKADSLFLKAFSTRPRPASFLSDQPRKIQIEHTHSRFLPNPVSVLESIFLVIFSLKFQGPFTARGLDLPKKNGSAFAFVRGKQYVTHSTRLCGKKGPECKTPTQSKVALLTTQEEKSLILKTGKAREMADHRDPVFALSIRPFGPTTDLSLDLAWDAFDLPICM